MKLTLLCIGKTDERFVMDGMEKYMNRLRHYISFSLHVIPDIKNSKNLSQAQQKAKEGESILKNVGNGDILVLLDERGKELRSLDLAHYLNKHMIGITQHLIFAVGGPYGFDPAVYARANDKISLSKMTFSHQMVRLFFVEQLYRAFSIQKGEPYHHE